MDSNLLAIIKKEKEYLVEAKSDNYLISSCDVHVKAENGFDDYLQNSVLSNNQQETFNYDNFKEEKQSCSICNENFINSHSLYKHNLIHLKVPLVRQKLFICEVCSNCYETKKQLQNHITTAHEDKKLYNRRNSLRASLRKCPFCKRVFKYKTWFDRHTKNCHEQTKLQCDMCKKFFKYKRTIKDHIKMVHEGIKRHWRGLVYQEGITFQCPKCPKILNCKYSVTKHLKSCHSEGTFQCKICKSVFRNKRYLTTHMSRVHYDDGMLHSCDICGKNFKSPNKVKSHKRYAHTQKSVTVQYPKCAEISSCKHLPNCHSEKTFQCKTFQCPKCPKIYGSKSAMTFHLKNCGKMFQCKICMAVLKKETSLLSHMNRLHYDYEQLRHCGKYRLYN